MSKFFKEAARHTCTLEVEDIDIKIGKRTKSLAMFYIHDDD